MDQGLYLRLNAPPCIGFQTHSNRHSTSHKVNYEVLRKWILFLAEIENRIEISRIVIDYVSQGVYILNGKSVGICRM